MTTSKMKTPAAIAAVPPRVTRNVLKAIIQTMFLEFPSAGLLYVALDGVGEFDSHDRHVNLLGHSTRGIRWVR